MAAGEAPSIARAILELLRRRRAAVGSRFNLKAFDRVLLEKARFHSAH
jgi:hypothetical protein